MAYVNTVSTSRFKESGLHSPATKQVPSLSRWDLWPPAYGYLSHFIRQHAFENLEADAKDGIVDELLNHGFTVFSEVAKNQWGSYCIQHSMSSALRTPFLAHFSFEFWNTVPRSIVR